MSALFALTLILVSTAWMLVKRYERHLDAQLKPWMTSELSLARVRRRPPSRRHESEMH